MLIDSFKTQFIKGLESLKTEILSFNSESVLWETRGSVKNSAGNLSLHLIGNLNHFIGAQLGKTGYVRDRETEFSAKNIRVETILNDIAKTTEMVESTFAKLTDDDLLRTFPLNTFGENKTTHEVLILLTGHLNYHLGQINYYRRLA